MRKLLSVVFIFLIASPTLAQTINLSGPFGNQEVNEGDEFATDVLGNAWDFSERRDVGWEENYNEYSINVNNGAWQATNSAQGSYFFPLFPGFTATLEVDSLPGDKSLPKIGSANRIDSNKYYAVSYKLQQSHRSAFAIYWESNPNKAEYWPDPSSPYIASADGYYHARGFTTHSGYNIYNFNLRSPGTDQVVGSWSNNIYAFRIDPSLSAPAGSTVAIDWMRLYDPGSAPNYNISWNTSGLTSESVTTVWVDTNNSGYDGFPVARYTHGVNPGSHSLPTAMLPPGTYYFYLTVQNHFGGSSFGSANYSGYSGQLKINSKADIVINSPSTLTGESYASTHVGNEWNMDTSVDLANLNTALWPNIWRQFSNHSFINDPNSTDGGSVFAATADAPLPGNTESDVGMLLNVSQARPIDPQKFRYVTYRMWIDPTNYPTISDKVRRGWYSRPFTYWNNNILQDAGYIKGHVVYEGWHTYTVDLWKDNILATGLPFRSFTSLRNARIEPGEFDIATNFKVDFLKLTAEATPTNNVFQIQYNLADNDNNSFSVDFYFDTDNIGFNGTYIGSANASSGSNTYNWNTTGIADGQYYIYLVVNDGVSTSKRYSSVNMRIGSTPGIQPRVGKAELDYDGDGLTDLTTYRASSPGFHAARSSLGYRFVPWGGAGFTPIYGDFDGDAKSDFGLLQDTGTATFAYIFYSSNDFFYVPEFFNFSGGQPIIADYDGDGKDEIALYNKNTGEWNIRYENGSLEVKSWGVPALKDIPVPGDYDGDKKADLAIYRGVNGAWYILNSSNGQFRAQSWGSPTYKDIPMPADFDNDGKTDFAVVRMGRYVKKNSRTRITRVDSGSGSYHIKLNASGATSSFIAVPGRNAKERVTYVGDIPFVGDKNGDGIVDVMLFRQQTGTWYVNHRSALGLRSFVWGRNGDSLPRRIR